MGKKTDMAIKGAAIVGALTAIPRVRHAMGELMVNLNENLGIPAARKDIDNDTPAETSTEGTSV